MIIRQYVTIWVIWWSLRIIVIQLEQENTALWCYNTRIYVRIRPVYAKIQGYPVTIRGFSVRIRPDLVKYKGLTSIILFSYSMIFDLYVHVTQMMLQQPIWWPSWVLCEWMLWCFGVQVDHLNRVTPFPTWCVTTSSFLTRWITHHIGV